MTTKEPRPPSKFLEEWKLQVKRTRQLIAGDEDEATEEALAGIGIHSEAEERIAADLDDFTPLADPEHFPEAHRHTIHALEVLERRGAHNARVPDIGPLTPIAVWMVENIAEYIVAGYSEDVMQSMRTLYARREVQCAPGSPEREMLTSARQEVDLVTPNFGGGGALLKVLIGGAAVPVIGFIGQSVGAIDLPGAFIVEAIIVALLMVFIVMAWLMLQGAAMAHRRCRMIMQEPLAVLWKTIGRCGDPPEDDSRQFALLAIILTGLVWFVLPAVAGVVLFFI